MPTIEEDLDRLGACIRGETGCSEMDEDAAALTRIRAALADREHLEYAARFLAGMLKRAEGDGLLVPEAATWLKAERARQSRKGGE